MTDTPRTGLEFVDAGTTDIDQPVNNNALALDALVGMSVVSATTTAEPALTSPTDDGKVYILPAGRTGTNWAAQAVGTIAQWYSGNWYFYAPWAGLQARAADTGIRYQYTTSWAVWASTGAQTALAGTGGTAGWLRGDGTVSSEVETSGGEQAITIRAYGGLARLAAERAGGTLGSPVAVTSGQNLFAFTMRGWNGSAFAESGGFQFSATENWAVGAHGTQFIVRTTSNGAASPTTRWVFANDGPLLPSADNTYPFGSASFRISADFVVTRNTSGAEYHSGEQSVSLTANTDNQTINSTTRVLRIASNGAYNLTGLTGGGAGRRLTLLNTSAFTITLTHDATSTAANRFFCPNNTNVSVRQNGSVEVTYDSTSSRWRVIGA